LILNLNKHVEDTSWDLENFVYITSNITTIGFVTSNNTNLLRIIAQWHLL
jgi:hypothetical protein